MYNVALIMWSTEIKEKENSLLLTPQTALNIIINRSNCCRISQARRIIANTRAYMLKSVLFIDRLRCQYGMVMLENGRNKKNNHTLCDLQR